MGLTGVAAERVAAAITELRAAAAEYGARRSWWFTPPTSPAAQTSTPRCRT